MDRKHTPTSIASPDNPRIKYFRRLQTQGAFRKGERRFLVEGPPAIRTLMENRIRPLQIIWCPELYTGETGFLTHAQKIGVKVMEISRACFEKISDVKTPQGIAALFSIPEYNRKRVLGDPRGLFLCCHGIQDPGNLGTMIRTANASGATGVVTIPPSVSFYNPKVVRSSAGLVLDIPLLELTEGDFLIQAEKAGINLYAAIPRGGTLFQQMRFKRPACIVIGSEAHGITPEILKKSRPVSIPMRKGVESLNAAVSAAILLYRAAEEKGGNR